jgi:hypothetical protein
VLTVGDAVTFVPVDALRLAVGDHVYDVPPAAVSTTLPPAQTDGVGGVTVMVGVGFIERLTVVESAHAPLEPTMVYVIAEVGLAYGSGQLVQLNAVAGFHVNVAAPLAFN